MPFASPAHDPRANAAGMRLAAMYPTATPTWAQPMANGPYMAPSPFGTPPAMGAPAAPAAPPVAPQLPPAPTTNAAGGPTAMAEPRASVYAQLYRTGRHTDGPAGQMMVDRFGPQPAAPVDPFSLLPPPPVEAQPVNPMAHVPALPPSPQPPDPSQYPPHLRAMQSQQNKQPHHRRGGRAGALLDRISGNTRPGARRGPY